MLSSLEEELFRVGRNKMKGMNSTQNGFVELGGTYFLVVIE